MEQVQSKNKTYHKNNKSDHTKTINASQKERKKRKKERRERRERRKKKARIGGWMRWGEMERQHTPEFTLWELVGCLNHTNQIVREFGKLVDLADQLGGWRLLVEHLGLEHVLHMFPRCFVSARPQVEVPFG
jgi:hypothetical protein